MKSLILYSILCFLLIGWAFCRNSGKFCDNNFIDAVLWDGINYKITRNEWIATYDHKTRSVGTLHHLSDENFQNEKGYYYQSVYHIPTVPECSETTVSCHMFDQLKGLTVYAIRRYFSSDKQSFDVIHRIHSNGNLSPLNDHILAFIESNLLPKRSHQKYRPSVYSPKDFTFIHITNQFQNFGPLLETIQLQRNGVIERTYHELNEFKDIIFITSFWWTFDQKVYIIGEHKSGIGNPFIYELELRRGSNVVLKPINKNVLEFFGCHKSRNNRLAKVIINKISEDDLGQWSVHTLETTTRAQNTTINEGKEQRAQDNRNPDTIQMRTTIKSFSSPTPEYIIDEARSIIPQNIDRKKGQIIDNKIDYRLAEATKERVYPNTEFKLRSTIETTSSSSLSVTERDYPLIDSRGPPTPQLEERRSDESEEQEIEHNMDQDYNGTEYEDRPFTLRIQAELLSGSVPDQDRIPANSSLDISMINPTANMKAIRMRKYTSLKISEFWKVFPIVVMASLLILSLVLLALGILSVSNLKNILKNDVKNQKSLTIDGLKGQRLKYDDFNDFFIEEFEILPKSRFPSVDNNSQTNESFENRDDSEGGNLLILT